MVDRENLGGLMIPTLYAIAETPDHDWMVWIQFIGPFNFKCYALMLVEG